MIFFTPFLIGLFSSIHCLAMCGGLCGVFCRNKPNFKIIALINIGRLVTYSLMGFIFAGFIQGLAIRLPIAEIGFWIRSILGIILIFLGIKIIVNNNHLYSLFENNIIWQKAKKQLHKITKLDSTLAYVSKGLIWGLIPCGLLYGVLLAAATTYNSWKGGLFMFAFGLGTLPSMFVAAGLMNSFHTKLQSQSIRYGAGAFIVIIGFWSLISPWFSNEAIPEHSIFTPIIAFLNSCLP